MFFRALFTAIVAALCTAIDGPGFGMHLCAGASYVQIPDPSPLDNRLEAAVRQYRVQVYDSYHLDRSEFDRRMTAWNELATRWSNTDKRASDYATLLDWIEQATYQSRADVGGPLPAMPDFVHQVESREAGKSITREAPERTTASRAEPRRTGIDWETKLPGASGTRSNGGNGPNNSTANGASAANIKQLAAEKSQRSDNASAPSNASPVTAASPELRLHNEHTLNVGELLARASGYRVGLRTLDSMLLDRPELEVEELSTILGELDTLVRQRRDLLLYAQLISGDQQSKLLQSLEFPKATIAELGSRIDRESERLVAQTGLDREQRDQRLKALEQLLQRLARLSEK